MGDQVVHAVAKKDIRGGKEIPIHRVMVARRTVIPAKSLKVIPIRVKGRSTESQTDILNSGSDLLNDLAEVW